MKLDWFIKKEDGSSFGPIDLAELREWAAEGRVAPEDQISTDQHNWSPSHENRDLHMDWTIDFEDGSTYGPIHLLAFADFMAEGIVRLDSEITNIRHEVSYALGEVLLPALVRSNTNLRTAIDELRSELSHSVEHSKDVFEKAQYPAEKTEVDKDLLPTSKEDVSEAKMSEKPAATIKDVAKEHKRSERWEKLYRDEVEKAEQRDAELNNALREQANQILELTTELDDAKSKLHNLEKMQREVEKIEELSKSGDENKFDALKSNYKQLMESYNQISLQYEQLSKHLEEQSNEIEDLRSAKSSAQEMADRRTRESLEEVHRERQEADKARAKLSRIEKEHNELLKSYREMNDQMIRMRQQVAP